MDTEATLKRWIREHKVTWELGRWREMVDHQPIAIDFELRLLARHLPHAHASPGCHECGRVYERLCDIARAAFPREHRPTSYDIEPFDSSFHLRPETQWAPEIQLEVRIVHRSGHLRAMDECEGRCVTEIQQRLARLGVPPGRWSNSHRSERGHAKSS